jgi:hypothetical protein
MNTILLGSLLLVAAAVPPQVTLTRFAANPLVRPEMSKTLGNNINGPSLIRVPAWVQNPLGRYYIYFAHHNGQFIRLAYADSLEGPWRIYEPGVLQAKDTAFAASQPGRQTHIASPDVHVDDQSKRIVMYFHGVYRKGETGQFSQAAVSSDGLAFQAQPAITKDYYLRVFRWAGWYYGMARTGALWRSKDPLAAFEPGSNVFAGSPYAGRVRHVALLLRNSTLYVFFSAIGDAPERIMLSTIPLGSGWNDWKASPPLTVLAPQKDYECAGLPITPSNAGLATTPVHQLRDPAIFTEGGKTYLFYSVCGEQGIAGAELTLN